MAAAAAPLVQLEGSIADVLMPITSGKSDFGGIGVSEDVSETVVSHTAVEGLVVKESLTVEDALERVDVGKELTPTMNGESVALLTPLPSDVETVIEPDILSAKSVAKSDESKESLSVVSPEAEDEAALLVSRSAEPLADGAALNEVEMLSEAVGGSGLLSHDESSKEENAGAATIDPAVMSLAGVSLSDESVHGGDDNHKLDFSAIVSAAATEEPDKNSLLPAIELARKPDSFSGESLVVPSIPAGTIHDSEDLADQVDDNLLLGANGHEGTAAVGVANLVVDAIPTVIDVEVPSAAIECESHADPTVSEGETIPEGSAEMKDDLTASIAVVQTDPPGEENLTLEAPTITSTTEPATVIRTAHVLDELALPVTTPTLTDDSGLPVVAAVTLSEPLVVPTDRETASASDSKEPLRELDEPPAVKLDPPVEGIVSYEASVQDSVGALLPVGGDATAHETPAESKDLSQTEFLVETPVAAPSVDITTQDVERAIGPVDEDAIPHETSRPIEAANLDDGESAVEHPVVKTLAPAEVSVETSPQDAEGTISSVDKGVVSHETPEIPVAIESESLDRGEPAAEHPIVETLETSGASVEMMSQDVEGTVQAMDPAKQETISIPSSVEDPVEDSVIGALATAGVSEKMAMQDAEGTTLPADEDATSHEISSIPVIIESESLAVQHPIVEMPVTPGVAVETSSQDAEGTILALDEDATSHKTPEIPVSVQVQSLDQEEPDVGHPGAGASVAAEETLTQEAVVTTPQDAIVHETAKPTVVDQLAQVQTEIEPALVVLSEHEAPAVHDTEVIDDNPSVVLAQPDSDEVVLDSDAIHVPADVIEPATLDVTTAVTSPTATPQGDAKHDVEVVTETDHSLEAAKPYLAQDQAKLEDTQLPTSSEDHDILNPTPEAPLALAPVDFPDNLPSTNDAFTAETGVKVMEVIPITQADEDVPEVAIAQSATFSDTPEGRAEDTSRDIDVAPGDDIVTTAKQPSSNVEEPVVTTLIHDHPSINSFVPDYVATHHAVEDTARREASVMALAVVEAEEPHHTTQDSDDAGVQQESTVPVSVAPISSEAWKLENVDIDEPIQDANLVLDDEPANLRHPTPKPDLSHQEATVVHSVVDDNVVETGAESTSLLAVEDELVTPVKLSDGLSPTSDMTPSNSVVAAVAVNDNAATTPGLPEDRPILDEEDDATEAPIVSHREVPSTPCDSAIPEDTSLDVGTTDIAQGIDLQDESSPKQTSADESLDSDVLLVDPLADVVQNVDPAPTTAPDKDSVYNALNQIEAAGTEFTRATTGVAMAESGSTLEESTSVVGSVIPIVGEPNFTPNEQSEVSLQDQVPTTLAMGGSSGDGALEDDYTTTVSNHIPVLAGSAGVVAAPSPVVNISSIDDAAIETILDEALAPKKHPTVEPTSASVAEVEQNNLHEDQASSTAEQAKHVIEPPSNAAQGEDERQASASTILAADGSPTLLKAAASVTEPAVEIATTVVNVAPHLEETTLGLATEAHILKDDSKFAIDTTPGFEPLDVDSLVAPTLEYVPHPSVVEPEVLSPPTKSDSPTEGDSTTAGDALTSDEVISIPTVALGVEEAVTQSSAVSDNDVADVDVQPILDISLEATASDNEVLTSPEPREGLSALSVEDKVKETISAPTQSSVLPDHAITDLSAQLAKDASTYLEVAEPEILTSSAYDSTEDVLPAITAFENLVDVLRTTSVPTNDVAEKSPHPMVDSIVEASINASDDPKAPPLQASPDISAEDNFATSDEVSKLEVAVSEVTTSRSLPTDDNAIPQTQLATWSDIVAPDLSTTGFVTTTGEAAALEEATSDITQTSALPDDYIAQTHFQSMKDAGVEAGPSNIAESKVLTPQATLKSSGDATVTTSAAATMDETVTEFMPTAPPFDASGPHPQPAMDAGDNPIKSGGADDDSRAVLVLATKEIKSQETAGDEIEDAVATEAVEPAVVECPPASDNALTLDIGGYVVVFDSRLTSREDDVSLAPTPKRKHAIEPEQIAPVIDMDLEATIPQLDISAETTALSAVGRPVSPWTTTSYSVATHHPVDGPSAESLDPSSPPMETLVTPQERPESLWTPSYSTAVQGSGSTNRPGDDKSTAIDTDLPSPDIAHSTLEGDGLYAAHTPSMMLQELAAVPPLLLQISDEQDAGDGGKITTEAVCERPIDVPPEPTVVTNQLLSVNDCTDEEKLKTPWTPSYSVTVMGNAFKEPTQEKESTSSENVDTTALSAFDQRDQSILQVSDKPIKETPEATAPSVLEPSGTTSDSNIVIVKPLPVSHEIARSLTSIQASQDYAPDRPKSPSYSVAMQGSPLDRGKDTQESSHVDSGYIPPNIELGDTSTSLSNDSLEIESKSQLQAFANPISNVSSPDAAPDRNNVPSLDTPTNITVTSHDVSSEGTTHISLSDEDSVDVRRKGVRDDKHPRPVPLRLAPVRENEATDASPSSETLSPTSLRKRHESTASSRFFPGGWFSAKSHGQASMEIASGEFTPLKSPIELPNVPPPTPIAPEGQKNRKSCIIM